MTKSIYDQVCEHINFFKMTYFAMQKAKLDCKGEIIEYNAIDKLKIVFEFEQFKKKFPDDYHKYFEDFLSQYEILYECFSLLFISDEENERVKLKITIDDSLNSSPPSISQSMYHLWFKDDLAYIIDNLKKMLNSKELSQELPNQLGQKKKSGKEVKGIPSLTRNQTALLFFYLREIMLIAQPTNENMAKAISHLTGHSANQIQDILRAPGTDAYQLGKDNDKVTRTDFRELKSAMKALIERIDKDYKNYSDNNELR